MKVSDAFVRCLENEGVKYVFGLPGEETEDLLFSLEDSTIEFIPVRHEQGAAFMADVWGRLTGKAGVCLSTLGPGATNLVTGIADAHLDKSPLVAVTGQGGLERLHQESHQNLDVVDMFRPITKWNTAVSDPRIVSEVVRKAFKLAQTEKPGATHVELSEDIANKEVNPSTFEPLSPNDVRRAQADVKAIRQAVDRLKRADRPLILAGNGAIRKRASKHLRDFSNRFDVPVVHTFMGKGAVSDRNPRSLFTIGLGFRDLVMEAVDRADLVMTVGYDVAEYAPERWNKNNDRPLLHVDFAPAEVYTHYQPEVEIVADISSSLRTLKNVLNQEGTDFENNWYEPIRERIHEDIVGYELENDEPFHTPGVVTLLREVMNDDDLLISDVGSHKMWIARNYLTCRPNGCIISNGLASMGIALPGGIAADLAEPERNIVCVMGDGGFLMNSQELETAQRLGTSMTVIVLVDNDYSLISWKQEMNRGHSTGTRFGNPDIRTYAESFGLDGYHPEDPGDLEATLEECVHEPNLSVIEVPIENQVNVELVEKLKHETTISESAGV